ncbi:peptidylprolyl isomerase [Novipirellula artificiosorum]|uniref:Peptidyl-prolyl cis-trans isomerase n=1 Tax=Novipirellula artificiosorum TaxID=2528016 RepID=A0A5C6E6Q2_9BACT|nr:peptidylprolyl isomerase [Novipirellula artificiosorum]TWU42859.1 Peptidyl-prolyl cis-trans isomerase cyp18 [Novipirellula artificiosorum]
MVLRFALVAAATFAAMGFGIDTATAQEPVFVQLDTSEGTIVLELNVEKAPKSVANFVQYVKDGFYKDVIFHRVIDGFMIQAGGYDTDMKMKKTLPTIRNEAGNRLSNEKYTIAMARKGDPHSADSQFFINTGNNTNLDRANFQDGFGYTVFGRVIEGQEVVDRIGKAATKSIPDPVIRGALMRDVPVTQIVIKDARVVEKK